MKFIISILILILVLLNFQTVAGAENEYGIVKAWFNGDNATVNGAQLKIGESAEIKVEVTSKINGHVFVEITEPGFTKAFNVLEGSKQDESIDNLKIETGWSKTFIWKITPNGTWKNGNAPINTVVQFHNLKTKNDEIIQFTIANPYILDEQYSGTSTSRTTPAPEITGTGAPTKLAPFPSAMFVFMTLLVAWRFRMRA